MTPPVMPGGSTHKIGAVVVSCVTKVVIGVDEMVPGVVVVLPEVVVVLPGVVVVLPGVVVVISEVVVVIPGIVVVVPTDGVGVTGGVVVDVRDAEAVFVAAVVHGAMFIPMMTITQSFVAMLRIMAYTMGT